MSIIKRKAGSEDIVKSILEFDAVPTEGSPNLVESGAVAQAIGNLGQPLQWKGPATVAELNAGITGIQPGWTYTLTDAGTLTDGSVKVDAGDEVAWTEDGEWFQVGPSLVELKADVVQAKSDIADIQDVVPEEASESNKLVTKDELDNVQESIQSGFTPKGEISVSDLNDLTTQSNGDQYILTDSGTITDGSVTVEAGDSVAWNSTDSVWYKVKQYALSKYGTDEIKNLQTSITAFRTGDVIPVDGPGGTAKMSKDDLLRETAQNALAGNLATAFDPTRTSDNPYKAGERVVYEGETYIFKVPHYGSWVAADAYKAGLQVKQFDPSYFEVGTFSFPDSQYGVGEYRVRSVVGYSLPMNAGDKIICIDSTNCYFWVEATDSSGTKTYTNLPVTTYTASSDVSVVIQLGYMNTDPVIDVSELVRRYVFVGIESPDEYVSNLVKKEVIDAHMLTTDCFVGGLSINLTSGAFSSNSSAAVTRTAIHLSAGDFVQFKTGINHKFGIWKIFDDGTTPSGGALTTGIIYIAKDCTCVFEFYADSGYSLNIDAIASNLVIYSQDGATKKFIGTLAKNAALSLQRLDPSLFHFGYSGVSNGVYTTTYFGFTGIVTDYLGFIPLKTNDVIHVLDSSYKFRVVRFASGGTPSQTSFSTGFYVLPSDCDCWIAVERVDGQTMTDDELLSVPSLIEIFSPYPQRSAEIRNAIAFAKARKANFEAHPSKIRLAAHRGETGVAPENTLPAFIAAKNNGYDFIETDVQFTSDGVPMILHDETIDRTSNGTGKLYELTYAQVRAYDFGSWKDARFAGTKIPTLEETLLLCKNIGLGIYLEFKPFGTYTFDSTEIESIINLVEKYGMTDHVLYAGRSDIVHALRPKASVVLGGNAITQPTIVSQALAVKGDNRVEVWGQVNDTFTESVVLELAENGIHLGAWTAAAQNNADIIRAIPKCCETIVTNYVDARGLFANMSLHGWT